MDDFGFTIKRPLSPKDNEIKKHATIAYIFMLLGIFTGFFWLLGAVWAMLKITKARGSVFEDHYHNIISTFWWGLVFSVLGVVLAIWVVGYFILLFIWFWSIIRIIKGTARLLSDKPYRTV